MDVRVPLAVRDMTEAYIEGLDKCLPGLIVGVYLHGSAALEAFDAQSDVDFLAIIRRKLTCEELVQLTDLHCELNEHYPPFIMEGSYVTNEDLGQSIQAPYFDGFMMTPASIGALNPITWWVIQERGICLRGLTPKNLTFQVSESDLISYVYENMTSYWKKRVRRLEQLWVLSQSLPEALPFDLDAEIEWTVLGILRQIYTLKEHQITSKLGAGQYGLDTLPAPYHPIIKEAIRIRNRKDSTLYHSNRERLGDTFQLTHYLFDLVETIYV
jgi:hypothetical protein